MNVAQCITAGGSGIFLVLNGVFHIMPWSFLLTRLASYLLQVSGLLRFLPCLNTRTLCVNPGKRNLAMACSPKPDPGAMRV